MRLQFVSMSLRSLPRIPDSIIYQAANIGRFDTKRRKQYPRLSNNRDQFFSSADHDAALWRVLLRPALQIDLVTRNGSRIRVASTWRGPRGGGVSAALVALSDVCAWFRVLIRIQPSRIGTQFDRIASGHTLASRHPSCTYEYGNAMFRGARIRFYTGGFYMQTAILKTETCLRFAFPDCPRDYLSAESNRRGDLKLVPRIGGCIMPPDLLLRRPRKSFARIPAYKFMKT